MNVAKELKPREGDDAEDYESIVRVRRQNLLLWKHLVLLRQIEKLLIK